MLHINENLRYHKTELTTRQNKLFNYLDRVTSLSTNPLFSASAIRRYLEHKQFVTDKIVKNILSVSDNILIIEKITTSNSGKHYVYYFTN